MAVEVVEMHKSRPGTHDAENPKLDVVYIVTGTDDEFTMDAAVDANAPLTWGPNAELNRQGWDWTQPDSAEVWYVTVHYDGRDPKIVGVQSVVMDNSGGMQHITQSLYTVKKGSPGFADTAPDHKGAIGVTDTGIEGTDIPFPKTELTVEVLELASSLEPNYIQLADAMVGKTNISSVSFIFHGQDYEFDVGEMVMTAFQNQYRGNGTFSFTFKFAISRNVENVFVGGAVDAQGNVTGGIDMGDKFGWDYLWVQYKEGTNAGSRTREPKAAYIEQVFEEAEFNDILFDRGWF